MKLFLISQNTNNNYDTFDSAIVAAKNEEAARMMHPHDGHDIRLFEDISRVWVSEPHLVSVELIGNATRGTKTGVILASFNAG